jgi:hypothetical protein
VRHQAIQYDPSTGQIRQVLDPQKDMGPEEVVKLLNPDPHELVLAYPKQEGRNALHEWQAHVTLKHGVYPADTHPDIEAHVLAKAQAANVQVRKA